MIKRALLVVVGIAALVLNPFFGCDGDPEFRYTADEMRAAIEGTWKLTVPATLSRPAEEIVFSISQATAAPTQKHSRRGGPVTEAAACSTRSLVKAASACGDTSEMPLVVTLLAGGDPVKAMFRVHGLTFQWGLLDATLGPVSLTAKVAPTGAISDVYLAGDLPGATMVRVSTAQR